MPAPQTLAHRLDDAACRSVRTPRTRRPVAARRVGLAAAALLAVGALGGCADPGKKPPAAPITAGFGTCQLPTLTVTPTEAAPGAKVHLSGKWFVEGCGGKTGLKPLLAMGLSFTDSTGKAQGLVPIDAKGETGVVEVDVTVPADAPGGEGKFILGTSAPVTIMINR